MATIPSIKNPWVDSCSALVYTSGLHCRAPSLVPMSHRVNVKHYGNFLHWTWLLDHNPRSIPATFNTSLFNHKSPFLQVFLLAPRSDCGSTLSLTSFNILSGGLGWIVCFIFWLFIRHMCTFHRYRTWWWRRCKSSVDRFGVGVTNQQFLSGGGVWIDIHWSSGTGVDIFLKLTCTIFSHWLRLKLGVVRRSWTLGKIQWIKEVDYSLRWVLGSNEIWWIKKVGYSLK